MDTGKTKMNDPGEENLDRERILFLCLRFSREGSPDSEERIKSVIGLRSYSKQYESVRQRLRGLMKDDDLLTKILAAEALSVAGAYPEEAVPILTDFMDRVRRAGLVEDYAVLLGICFLALYHYGTKASSAGPSVWMYIYGQNNLRLKVGAVGVISHFAKASKTNRMILRRLCKSKTPEVREKARSIVRSREFIAYMRDEIE